MFRIMVHRHQASIVAEMIVAAAQCSRDALVQRACARTQTSDTNATGEAYLAQQVLPW
jgi:hypothetical protein